MTEPTSRPDARAGPIADPITDPDRLRALAAFGRLDTAPEKGLDDAAKLAALLCGAPTALVTLVDGRRQVFAAREGFDGPPDAPLDAGFCPIAVRTGAPLVIRDTLAEGHAANPAVSGFGVRFYAGTPLRTSDGAVLGTLCVLDRAPRPGGLTPAQLDGLSRLADQVVGQLDLRRALVEERMGDRERRAYGRTQVAIAESGGDLDAILDALVAGAMEAVPAADGGVMELLDGDALEYRSVRGSLAPHQGVRVPLEGSTSGACARTRAPILLVDALTDPRVKADLAPLIGLRSGMHAPVIRAGRVLGVLKLQSREPDAFTVRDLERVTAFAGLATAGLTEASEVAAQRSARLSETRYRALFEAIDEGFCVIEFIDGPRGPLDDYVHVEANPAYERHTGIPGIVGRRLRELAPEEAEGWLEIYGGVLRTGVPVRFERTFVLVGRQLEVTAHRVEPPERRQVAVLFQDVTERARARERFRLAIEATQVGIFDYNLVTGELGWDGRVRALFGVAPDAPVGYAESFLAALHPEDRARADAAVQAALDPAGPGRFDITYRVRALDTGVLRWIAARGQAVVADGRTERFVGTVRDITAERAAADALRATEERYRLATRATNDAIRDWDLAAGHVLWNSALTAAYGHAPEMVEPTGAWWIARIHPDDRARVEASVRAVLEGGATVWSDEYRFRRADGAWADVFDRGHVIRGAEGRATRMIAAMLDLTERKRSEAALRQLNETLEEQVRARTAERDQIWRAADDLLCVASREGYLVGLNPAWTATLGWSAAELKARPFLDFVHPDDHAVTVREMARLLDGEAVRGFENRYRHRDGGHRWLSWNAVPREGRIFATVRDVTAAREQAEALAAAEDALRQAQKMEAVGQLTGGLAHDFNNLLAGISGALELMGTRIEQGRLADVDRYMVAAQGATKRAAALTHRLLAFSRRQTLAPKPTDVNALVAGMLDLIRRTVGPGIAVEGVGAAGLWPALVDPSQLENALLNLCINARDAMPEGGRITVETANRWLDRAAARGHDLPEGQYLSLCVSDTGTGMSADVIAKAFDPFFTTKPIGQGTGLGLSMIYGFAKQSGGQVRIYSEVGQGTMVCLYLPRHRGAVESADPLSEIAAVPRAQQGETVLVVDDEPTVRMLVADVLADLGYTAVEAADGATALRVLRSDVRLDLLVTDVGLPGGMNGRQVADAARVSRPDLQVLFITGYAENALLNNGQLEPGMSVLTKPFAVDVLAARIREMIAR